MPKINIASMHQARKALLHMPMGHAPKRETLEYRGEFVDLTVRRCSRGGQLTGGVVVSASMHGGQLEWLRRGPERRCSPGYTYRELRRAVARCIHEAHAQGCIARKQDEFMEWFEGLAIPDETLDAWVAGEDLQPDEPRNTEGYRTCYQDMDDTDMDYWRAKVNAMAR